jgi:hypothetical protein
MRQVEITNIALTLLSVEIMFDSNPLISLNNIKYLQIIIIIIISVI